MKRRNNLLFCWCDGVLVTGVRVRFDKINLNFVALNGYHSDGSDELTNYKAYIRDAFDRTKPFLRCQLTECPSFDCLPGSDSISDRISIDNFVAYRSADSFNETTDETNRIEWRKKNLQQLINQIAAPHTQRENGTIYIELSSNICIQHTFCTDIRRKTKHFFIFASISMGRMGRWSFFVSRFSLFL